MSKQTDLINIPDAITVSGSNVGIGTSSPTALLHIDGTSPNLVFGSSGNELTYLQRYNNDFYVFNKETSGNLLFGTANTERMKIDSSGNVGIGTSSSYPLTVQSGTAGSNHAIALRNSSNNFSRLGFLQTDSATAAYTSIDGDGRTSGYLKFNTNDTERMKIDSLGRVTTPYQPSFYVKDLAFSSGANSAGTSGTLLHNIGAHYSTSNGRFTAPVAGTYIFYGSVQFFLSGSSDYVSITFNKNGVQQGIEFVSGIVQSGGHYNDHHTQEGMAIIYCNASDYVNIRATRGARNQTQNVFGGYLLG